MDRNHDAFRDLGLEMRRSKSTEPRLGLLSPLPPCSRIVSHTRRPQNGLEKALESPLDCKEIQPVHPKGNQSWIFIGRTEAEAETPIHWPFLAKSLLIGKDPDAGTGRRQEEKGTREDATVGWHHWLNGHEFEQALGVGDGQGGLVCCSPWGLKMLDHLATELKYKWKWYHTCFPVSYFTQYDSL